MILHMNTHCFNVDTQLLGEPDVREMWKLSAGLDNVDSLYLPM